MNDKIKMDKSKIEQAKEVLGDILISIRNHKRGISRSDPDYKRFNDRENALSQVLSEYQELEKKVKNLYEANETLRIINNQVEVDKIELQAQLEEMKKSLSENFEKGRQVEIERYEKEIAQLKESCLKYEDEIEKQAVEIEQIEFERDNLSEESKRLHTIMELGGWKDREIEKLQAQLEEMGKENKRLSDCYDAELGVCQEHCEVIQEIAEHRDIEMQAKDKEIASLKEKESDKLKHLRSLLAQDYTAGRMSELEQEISRLQAIVSSLPTYQELMKLYYRVDNDWQNSEQKLDFKELLITAISDRLNRGKEE